MSQNIVVLTGSGISAEAGIPTFRSSDGLWENHRIEEVATPEAFYRNPNLVHQFYNLRRQKLKDPLVQPTLAHLALAELEKQWTSSFSLITQNVDDLHERAGSKNLIHMHGELQKALCSFCKSRFEWLNDLSRRDVCRNCGFSGRLRPDIVWFGESPYHLSEIDDALDGCDIFISIGTSGKVYPAAGFAELANAKRKIEINIAESDISNRFNEHRIGLASIEVPLLVRKLFEESENLTNSGLPL